MLDKSYPPPVKLQDELPSHLKVGVFNSKDKRCLYKEMEADFRLDSFYNKR